MQPAFTIQPLLEEDRQWMRLLAYDNIPLRDEIELECSL